MQLKYDKQIKNQIITIELETTNFTIRENAALERFGEPVVSFEKVYDGDFPVSFNKKIKTGFKVRVKFDGTQNLQAATDAANLFFDEIQEVLRNELSLLNDRLTDLEVEFRPANGLLDILY
jgi:hypothetical protein